ncbi:MAG: hypothetical protein AABY37_03675 [Actinomycetota bacterium]
MPDIANQFVVAVVAQDECRIWATGVERGKKPEKIYAPGGENSHRHIRKPPLHGGHHVDEWDREYFESITHVLAGAGEILGISHGEGKSNSFLKLVKYFEKMHPDLAKKVVGNIEVDVTSLTEPEILALAREWYDKHHGFN